MQDFKKLQVWQNLRKILTSLLRRLKTVNWLLVTYVAYHKTRSVRLPE